MSQHPDDLLSMVRRLALGSLTARDILRNATPAELILLGDAAEQLAVSETALAVDAGERLVGAADASFPAAVRARFRRALGQALNYANRFDEAHRVLTEALSVAGEEAPVEAARAGLALVHTLARLGRLREALEIGERSREELTSRGESVSAAKADVNLGVICRMLDRPRDALQHFDRALPPLAENGMIRAQIQSNRGEALLDLCDFAEAEVAFAQALGEFERCGAARAASIVEGNLADLLSRQGRMGESLHRFERARLRLQDAAAEGDAARLSIEQAEVQFGIGLLDEAMDSYRRAIPVLEAQKLRVESARACLGLARVLALRGELPAALEPAGIAESGFAAAGQPLSAARARLTIGQIQLMRGDRDAGTESVREAMRQLAERPTDLVFGHILLSQDALAAGDHQRALFEAGAAVSGGESIGLFHVLPHARHLRGRSLSALGLHDEAAEEFEKASHGAARLRGSLPLDRFRSVFASSTAEIFADTASELIAIGALDRAFEAVQLGKSGSLVSLLMHGSGAPAGQPDPDLAGVERSLLNLRALINRLHDARGPENERSEVASRVLRAERDLEEAEARASARRGYREFAASPADLRGVQSKLPSGWALLECFPDRGAMRAFLVWNDGYRLVELGEEARLDQLADALQFEAAKCIAKVGAGLPASPARMDRLLTELGALVLGPLEEHIPAIRGLVVGPSGALHGVPFHALRLRDRYLCQSLVTLRVPSGSAMAILAERPDQAGGGCAPLIIAVPDEAAPDIAAEGQQLARSLRSVDLLAGAEATIGAVGAACEGRPIVHFACHGVFQPIAGGVSGLKLADGWLGGRDVLRLPLDQAIVTLSGCETGKVNVEAGDEFSGLIRAFLGAGANAVLGTLWPVHDRTTTELLGQIYEQWYALESTRGRSLAEGLQQVQQEAIVRGLHPVLWSPFFVIGAP